MRGLRAAVCLAGTIALGLLAGGTPEREIYVSVSVERDSAAPDTVLIETYDVIPANVAPGQEDVPAYAVSLTCPSALRGTSLCLVGLGFRIEDLDGSPIDPGEVIVRVQAQIDGSTVSSTSGADRAPSAGAALPAGDADDGALLEIYLSYPAAIPAGEELEIEISADVDPLASLPGFTIALAEQAVCISHSGCPDPVRLVRHGDSAGPVVSKTTILSNSLSGSFSNYPNPFSAGRELTTFTFYLQRRADVGLKLYNGFGRLIRVLDPGTSRAGGQVHEDITWNGTDEDGAAVQNGAYFAVLSVRYDDGRSDRAIRKVAVLR